MACLASCRAGGGGLHVRDTPLVHPLTRPGPDIRHGAAGYVPGMQQLAHGPLRVSCVLTLGPRPGKFGCCHTRPSVRGVVRASPQSSGGTPNIMTEWANDGDPTNSLAALREVMEEDRRGFQRPKKSRPTPMQRVLRQRRRVMEAEVDLKLRTHSSFPRVRPAERMGKERGHRGEGGGVLLVTELRRP